MEFVNASGQKLDIAAMKAEAGKKRKSTRAASDSYHKGWLVSGFTPEDIQRGRADHEAVASKNRSLGRPTPPWDEELWMRNARPAKVRSKPFETQGAAADAKALAERSGWKRVVIVEASKGKL